MDTPETGLVRRCDSCGKVTACSLDSTDKNMQALNVVKGQSVFRVPLHTCLVTGIPRVDSSGDGFAFKVVLYPSWKTLMGKIEAPNYVETRNWLESVGRELLSGCGYDSAIYQTFNPIRLSFGEWGLEHITIPGNGCGLDITSDSCECPEGGMVMLSHNVDYMKQAYLLQCIFNWWAHYWILQQHER